MPVFAGSPPGISPSAVRTDRLDQPERRMDLHVRFRRKWSGTRLRRFERIRRQDHRAVRSGEQTLGRRTHGLHRSHLVSAHDPHPGRLGTTQRDTQLRGRVLHLRGVCRRPLRRAPFRGQLVVLLRHHRVREAGRQPQPGRPRHERPAQRQTDRRQTVAAIRLAQLRLHPHDGHLADGVDGGGGSRGPRPRPGDDRHRPAAADRRPAVLPGKPERAPGDPPGRRQDRRHAAGPGVEQQRRRHPGQKTQALESGRPVPLRPDLRGDRPPTARCSTQ